MTNQHECPICNRVDLDGLEACAVCYNGLWSRAAQWEQRAKQAEARLAAAVEGVVVEEHPTPVEYRTASGTARSAWFLYKNDNPDAASVRDFLAGFNAGRSVG